MEQGKDARPQSAAPFNGEMFRLGRQFRALSQKDFAEAVGVEASTASRVENCVSQATAEMADRAAAVLNLPLDFFRQVERPYGLPMSVHPLWRAKAVVPQYSIDQALAELNIRIMHVRRFLRPIEYEPVLPLPELDLGDLGGDAAQAAMMVRRAWMMPAGPVIDLVQWVERAGCFVMLTDLPDAAMSGVTLRVPDMRPCIFLNRSMPADRMRLTLAHELGHLILHRYPSPEMEQQAYAFGAAFLMPAHDIKPYFAGKKIDLQRLAALKPEWRVSMQALLYRASELGYISENQARYLWQQFNARKLKLREPPELDLQAEAPSLVKKLLTLHIERLGYTVADLAAVAALHEADFARLYDLDRFEGRRPKLRIVG